MQILSNNVHGRLHATWGADIIGFIAFLLPQVDCWTESVFFSLFQVDLPCVTIWLVEGCLFFRVFNSASCWDKRQLYVNTPSSVANLY